MDRPEEKGVETKSDQKTESSVSEPKRTVQSSTDDVDELIELEYEHRIGSFLSGGIL